jgi:hypothetical protein
MLSPSASHRNLPHVGLQATIRDVRRRTLAIAALVQREADNVFGQSRRVGRNVEMFEPEKLGVVEVRRFRRRNISIRKFSHLDSLRDARLEI